MPKGFQGKKKGSRAEKIAIAKAQRAKNKKKPKRKTTTRTRRTTRKGDLTLQRKRAFPSKRKTTTKKRKTTRRNTNKDSMWNW